ESAGSFASARMSFRSLRAPSPRMLRRSRTAVGEAPEPRFTGPSNQAGAIGSRYDELAASGGGTAPRFERTFRTRIVRLDSESISLTELDDDFHEMRIALR